MAWRVRSPVMRLDTTCRPFHKFLSAHSQFQMGLTWHIQATHDLCSNNGTVYITCPHELQDISTSRHVWRISPICSCMHMLWAWLHLTSMTQDIVPPLTSTCMQACWKHTRTTWQCNWAGLQQSLACHDLNTQAQCVHSECLLQEALQFRPIT